jgi:hypothetical protein
MAEPSLREIINRGVELKWFEAVAIAQQLIASIAAGVQPAVAGDVRPTSPLGPPSLDNVRLTPDGSVVCRACARTPAVSEIAVLLEAMLPRRRTPAAPGALRYTIARALLEVDAPPFDSLAELSAALTRLEQGERSGVLRDLSARAAAMPSKVVAFDGERRRRAISATELRRQLRQADEALYRQMVVMKPAPEELPVPVSPDSVVLRNEPANVVQAAQRTNAARWMIGGAVAASIAFGAGYGLVKQRQTVTPVPRTVSVLPSPAVDPLSTRSPVTAPDTPAARAHDAFIVRAVSRSTGPTFSPSFASNGAALFFHTGKSSDARSALAAADLKSGDVRVMTILDDGARNFHAQPSPDGTRVAFDSDRDGERGVYIANRDGTGERRISGPGFAAVPTWSPDGTRLAFIRGEAHRPHVWNLWLLDIDTTATRRLTSFRFGQTWSASWFSDGRRICYTHEDRLIVRDLNSGSTREYASPVLHRLVRTPAVSPDGRHVMFQVARSGAWLLDLDTASMRCVLTDPTAEEFAWSPDGRRVAFHSRRDGQWGIWLMAPTE